jgi:hypothetical protein
MLTPTPFAPYTANTAALSATTSTARVALNRQTNGPQGAITCRIHNAHSSVVFIKFGDSAVDATTSSMPIPAGGVEVFSIGDSTHVAGITGTGSGTVYATCGMGA